MPGFRAFLLLIWILLAGYTAMVAAEHGLGLFAVFFGDILALTWPGQFNLDFLLLLTLCALWVAWRHRFSRAGWALGTLVLVGGVLALVPYLLVAIARANNDPRALLLGKHA